LGETLKASLRVASITRGALTRSGHISNHTEGVDRRDLSTPPLDKRQMGWNGPFIVKFS
jgi:hypothetical protein